MPLELDRDSAWLSREDLDQARDKLPILYVTHDRAEVDRLASQVIAMAD